MSDHLARSVSSIEEIWLKSDTVILDRKRVKPVLPSPRKENFLITSALPYVNNVPHLGNIVGSVLSADIYARYCRLCDFQTLFICGTDEYGTATETKALVEDISPVELCDKYYRIHEEIYEWFNISFDYFGRTSVKEHSETCQNVYGKLEEHGCTFKQTVEQLFCERCDRFLADRFIEGECPICSYEDARGDQCDQCGKLMNAVELRSPKCKLCKKPPILRSSGHVFLDLPKLGPTIEEWIKENSAEWSFNAKNITDSWLKEGLKARCITRDIKWGVPVPNEPHKVFYVWFDATLGYITLTKRYTSEWEKWWKLSSFQINLVQFMAKDNVLFHSIIFPAVLRGSQDEYVTPKRIFATEYLNYENKKFSKSRSIGIFGDQVKSLGIPADIWRFYLAAIRPETQDSNFLWSDFLNKVNSELLNNLGNFCLRTLKFIENNFDGEIQPMDLESSDVDFISSINDEVAEFHSYVDKGFLRKGIKTILKISRLGNQHLQSERPWELLRSNSKNRAGAVVSICANIVLLLGILIQIYMPETASILLNDQLKLGKHLKMCKTLKRTLKPGHKIGKIFPLFKKIDESLGAKWKEEFGGSSN